MENEYEMPSKPKLEFSFYEKFCVWVRWNLYCIAVLAIWTIIKVQFYGKEMTVYSLGFQNRPVIDSEQREMLAQEELARRKKNG